MAEAVYIVGTLTSVACAILLLRGYARVRQKLLLWSGLCFVGLAISNLLIFVDLVMLPQVNPYWPDWVQPLSPWHCFCTG